MISPPNNKLDEPTGRFLGPTLSVLGLVADLPGPLPSPVCGCTFAAMDLASKEAQEMLEVGVEGKPYRISLA